MKKYLIYGGISIVSAFIGGLAANYVSVKAIENKVKNLFGMTVESTESK